MNQRERILALTVGILLAGSCLYYGGRKIVGVLTARADTIESLKEEIESKDLQRRRGMKARRILDEYTKRALPDDEALANSRYRAWLHEWVESAQLNGADVKWVSRQTVTVDKERAHDVHTFSVILQGTLPQLVTLLYDFYSQDYLHRIKLLHAKPLKDKQLALKFTIEAMAMPGVPDKELADMPSSRLALEHLDDYRKIIVGRNLYSPANQPPKFASSRTQRGVLNQTMSFVPEVEDPEKGNLTFSVEHDGLEGLTIDPKTGDIEWTPTETGEFEILVHVTDDGLPAREVSQTIQVEVSDPPPPRDEAPPPRRTFDEAKYTFVTGIVEVNGRRQVWLTVRTDGTWLRLHEGETFQVGAMDGRVLRIHPRSVDIEAGDTVYSIRFGQSLHDGEVVREYDDEVATVGD